MFLLRPSCPKKAEDGSHCLKRMSSKSYKSYKSFTTMVVAFNSNTLLLSKLPNHLGNPERISVFFSTGAGFNFKRLTWQTYKHKDISHISSISFKGNWSCPKIWIAGSILAEFPLRHTTSWLLFCQRSLSKKHHSFWLGVKSLPQSNIGVDVQLMQEMETGRAKCWCCVMLQIK